MGLLAGLAYFGLIGILLYSAFKHRGTGWMFGIFFALFLLTFPWLMILLSRLLDPGP